MLPAEAERGVRGALRRRGESCLVNAVVLQAWEAAHGRRRDLVVGITGLDGFRAHAWLEGDPVPIADDAGHDASMLYVRRDAAWTAAPDTTIGSGEVDGDSDGTARPFNEILRRPAPHYQQR
jgi:hypothetical protein